MIRHICSPIPLYFEFSISDRIDGISKKMKDEIFEFWIFTKFLFLYVYIRRAEFFSTKFRIFNSSVIWMEPIEEYLSRIERWNFRISNFLFGIECISSEFKIFFPQNWIESFEILYLYGLYYMKCWKFWRTNDELELFVEGLRVSYVFFVIIINVIFVFRPDICTRYFYKCFKSPFYRQLN